MANEAFGSCEIVVDGVRYGNFIKLTFNRDKEDATSGGTITLSWPGAEMFNAAAPIAAVVDGAKGTLMLDGQLACTFRIDSRVSHGDENSYRLDLAFRGLASAIVDSHADHPSGQENKKSPGQISKKLMEGYESQLEDKSGESRKLERFIVQEGESVERAMRRCCREFGLVFSENEQGNVVLQKKGTEGGAGQPLVLGKNFYAWSVKRDISGRFQTVKAKGNAVPTDKKYGKDAEELGGQAKDQYVKFKKQFHLLIDSDHEKQTLKKRAKAEAGRRKASGLDVQLTMSTWSDDGGQLWKVGKTHQVVIPVDNVADTLQIKSVQFELDDKERKAIVTLVGKDAFDDGGDGEGGGGGDSGGAASGGGGSMFDSPISGSVL
jgi:prophage tail gpP-like protein